jgi:hypothetical protein
MPIADVNWILSSTVQSGAALVAIVGGLLGSRYVALDAEQQAARRRLDQVKARLESARTRVTNAREGLDNFRVRGLLYRGKCYEAIYNSGSRMTIDELLEETQLDDKDVPRDVLEEHFDLLRDEVGLAKKTLSSLIEEIGTTGDWSSFRRSHKIATSHDAAWKWTYDHVSEILKARRREEEQKSRNPYDLRSLLHTPDMSKFANAAAMRTVWAGTESRLITAKEDAESEVARLEGELHAASMHADDVAQPEGFSLALSVLAYISLVSIVIPTGLMIAGPIALPQWSRILVALLFLSGVGLLMRYLFVYAAYLRQPSKNKALPTSILGLLRRTHRPRGRKGAAPPRS